LIAACSTVLPAVFTLPLVLRLAVGVSAARDAAMAQVFKNGLNCARVSQVKAFLEGLGVGTRFEDYGVSPAESERMIASAMQGVRGRIFIGAKRRSRVNAARWVDLPDL
jgi:hypothetical protein